jgi:hypothetical protein
MPSSDYHAHTIHDLLSYITPLCLEVEWLTLPENTERESPRLENVQTADKGSN